MYMLERVLTSMMIFPCIEQRSKACKLRSKARVFFATERAHEIDFVVGFEGSLLSDDARSDLSGFPIGVDDSAQDAVKPGTLV